MNLIWHCRENNLVNHFEYLLVEGGGESCFQSHAVR